MGRTVAEIYCDNLVVVSVLQSGKTKDPILATFSRNIFMFASKFDIFLKVSHVPGKHNIVADLLSRWDNSDKNRETLSLLVPQHQWVEVQNEHFIVDWEI